jgi:hypothetical protein
VITLADLTPSDRREVTAVARAAAEQDPRDEAAEYAAALARALAAV